MQRRRSAGSATPRLEGLGGSWHDGKIKRSKKIGGPSRDGPATWRRRWPCRSSRGDERREVWRSRGPIRGPPPTHRVHRSPGGSLVANHLSRRDPTGHGQRPLTGDRFRSGSCSIAGCLTRNGSIPRVPNRQLAFDPRELDAVIVSHAHNDHIGRLPLPDPGGLYRADLHHPGHRRHHQRDAARQRADPARGGAQRPRQVSAPGVGRAALRAGRRRVADRAAPSRARTGRRSRSCRASP